MFPTVATQTPRNSRGSSGGVHAASPTGQADDVAGAMRADVGTTCGEGATVVCAASTAPQNTPYIGATTRSNDGVT
jgi:hypothetical protein